MSESGLRLRKAEDQRAGEWKSCSLWAPLALALALVPVVSQGHHCHSLILSLTPKPTFTSVPLSTCMNYAFLFSPCFDLQDLAQPREILALPGLANS